MDYWQHGANTDTNYAAAVVFGNADVGMFNVQVGHDAAQTNEFRFHIHFLKTTFETAGTNIHWEFSYKLAKVGEAFPTSWTTVGVTNTVNPQLNTNLYVHSLQSLAAIPVTNVGSSAVFLCRVSRVNDAAQTYTDSVTAVSVDCHYKKRVKPGSIAEY